MRERIQVRVSDDGKAGWKRAARQHHVTLSALVDAVGRALATGQMKIPRQVVDEAHRIEQENRERS